MKNIVIRGLNILAAAANGLKLSWKMFLNLGSQRLLKPSLNPVSNCIDFGLLQKKTLFQKGHINFKMLSLN